VPALFSAIGGWGMPLLLLGVSLRAEQQQGHGKMYDRYRRSRTTLSAL
jgi:hypothetical protein